MSRPDGYVRKKLTFTHAEGASGATLTDTETITIEGELLNIHQVNSANTGTRTAQIIIKDVDAYTIFDGTAKAHNASYDHEFGVTIRRILTGYNVVTCVLSGDPGSGGSTVVVVITSTGCELR